jgi:hypothetical protein
MISHTEVSVFGLQRGSYCADVGCVRKMLVARISKGVFTEDDLQKTLGTITPDTACVDSLVRNTQLELSDRQRMEQACFAHLTPPCFPIV